LERRLRAGEPCRAEDLFAAFPALAADPDAALELIYTEFVVREELGQRPLLAEWPDRFPQWGADLQQLFQVHGFVRDDRNAATAVAATMPTGVEGPGSGRRLGDYELLEEVGRGGMGVVYKARQPGLNRLVALKMILAGGHAGARDLVRFRREAEAAARLQHPNIVQIHEVGEQDGRPFLALEFVDGGNLAQRLARGPLPAREAAQLVETLARAMHYAHQRGVVHRDLKPANVLLSFSGRSQSGVDATPLQAPLCERPLNEAVPKITDFGLAKQPEDGADPTQTGAILGTPSYMAPEQAAGKSKEVGPAADLYALGAILYETLAGRPPFQAASALDTLEQVRSQEPVAPTRLQPKVPRDLETVCLKCLRKDPARRYASALDLADDLRRFLDGKPIQARPVHSVERLARWCRRNPVPAGLAAALVLALAVGFAGVTWKWLDAEEQKGRAEDEARAAEEARGKEATQRQQKEAALQEAQANLYFYRIHLAHREWLANHVGRAEQILGECPADLRRWEWRYLDRLGHSELLTLRGHTGKVRCVAFSPDGTCLATGGWEQAIKLWNATNGRVTRELDRSIQGAFEVVALTFSADGTRLAAISSNYRLVMYSPTRQPSFGLLQAWDVSTGKEIVPLRVVTGPIEGSAAFSPDDRRLFVAFGAGSVQAWDTVTGREILPRPTDDRGYGPLACSPDGRTLARPGRENRVLLWEVATGRELRACRGHTDAVQAVAFSLDGKRLASAGLDRTVRIWDVATGEALLTRWADEAPSYVAFSPDGRRLVSGGAGGTVRIRDGTTGQELATLRSNSSEVAGFALGPDGKRLAWATDEPTVKVWDAVNGQETRTLCRQRDEVRSVAFGPGPEPVAAVGMGTTVRVWDAATG
jgi:WD40 repeat protein